MDERIPVGDDLGGRGVPVDDLGSLRLAPVAKEQLVSPHHELRREDRLAGYEDGLVGFEHGRCGRCGRGHQGPASAGHRED